MSKPFDVTKPVQTRDGRKARIICTDRDHIDGSIVALIQQSNGPHEGEETILSHFKDGCWTTPNGKPHSNDLINIPVKKTGWMCVTTHVAANSMQIIGKPGYIYRTKERAEEARNTDDIILEVSWEG
jgi:hypothetical protein